MNPRSIFLSLLISGFLLVNQVYAFGLEDHADDLMVSLKNTGSENCYLIEKNISSGQLSSYQNIPSTLYATGENQGFIMSGKTSEITLRYNCGSQKVFSLYMRNFWKAGHWHRSLDKKFDAIDVFETHEEKLGWRKYTHCKPPGEGGCETFGEATIVSWVITH
jgi:hypothetical protein